MRDVEVEKGDQWEKMVSLVRGPIPRLIDGGDRRSTKIQTMAMR